jgi:hypothetical protein
MSMGNHGGMISTGENSWFVYQSSLSQSYNRVIQYKIRRNLAKKIVNLTFGKYFCSYFEVLFFTCRKILRQGVSGFIYPPKEGVLRIFIALENPSPCMGLNPLILGQVASTLIITPPRRLHDQCTTGQSNPEYHGYSHLHGNLKSHMLVFTFSRPTRIVGLGRGGGGLLLITSCIIII